VILIGPDPNLQISTAGTIETQKLSKDFLPVLDSPPAHIRAPIVFVGYGIVDPAGHLDDYAGTDANNCIVLFLRGKPDHYKGSVTHAEKVKGARQKGAIAYLTAVGPVLSSYEVRRGVTGQPSAFYGLAPATEDLPGAWISTTQAEHLIAGTDQSNQRQLRALQEQLNQTPKAQSFRTEYEGVLDWDSQQVPGSLINVVASLPGKDPVLTQETVMIGAHRDHFGQTAGLLFPGADDNASGTAVMLEVARVVSQTWASLKRTIIFVSFSGEEAGLIGSREYVQRPLAPLGSTKAMINIDHAGIGNGRLTIGVTGLDKTFAMDVGQVAEVADRVDLFGFFPGGDHVPFKEAGVPTVTVVSGGPHPHFHQPTDTADTIDRDILQSVARYVLALAWQLANAQ
jgi:hypothetical protein